MYAQHMYYTLKLLLIANLLPLVLLAISGIRTLTQAT